MAFLEALIAQNFADDEADPPSGALGALTPGEERDIPNASGVSLGPPKWVPLNSKKGGPMEFPLPKTKQESPAADAVPAAAAPAAAAPAAAAAKFEQQSTPAAAPAENSIDGVPVMKYDSLFAFSDNAKDDWEAVRNVPRIRHKKEAGPPSASEGGALPADGRSRRLALLQALPKPQGAPSGCLGTLGSSSGLELRIQEAGDNAAAATTAAGDAALQMMPRVLQQKRRPEAKVEKDGPGAPEGPPSAAEKDEAGVEKQQPEATPAAAATAEEAAEGDGFLTSMFTLYESDGEEEVTKEAPSSSSSSCSSSSSSSSSAEVEAAKVVKFPEAAAAPEAREAAATAAAAAAVPKPQPGRAWVTEGDQEVLEELGIDAALLQGSGISSAEVGIRV